MLIKAIQIATEAHRGQLDKAGMPYIEHPLRVMAMGSNENEMILGVLHDVVEDSEWTFERLAQEGFSDQILDALRCVTKLSDSEPYDEFIKRVKGNELAVRVKLNDLTDNMDIRRLPYLSEKDFKRLRKYLKAYKQLSGEPTYSIAACRAVHANAYEPWTREDDQRLELLWCEGKTRMELSAIFKRKPSAIDSRINKLELKEKYL